MILGLVTFAHLTRSLGPERFGVLSWGLALVGYFTIPVNLGLSVLGTRELARDPERARTLVNQIIGLRAALVLGAFGIYILFVLLIDRPGWFKAVLALQGLALFGHAATLEWVYMGLERMGIIALRNVVASVLTLVGAVVLVRSPDDVVLAAAVTVAALLLANGWLVGTYWRDIGGIRPEFDWGAWKCLLRPAIPIGMSLLMMVVYTSTDQLMLGLMRPEIEVGWYAAAFRLLTAALIPGDIIYQAFIPALSSAYGSEMLMKERGRMFAVALLVFGLPVALGGAMLAQDLIVIFSGAEYIPATSVLVVLMVGAGLTYLGKVFGDPLIAWNRERSHMRILVVGAIMNVVLNLVLIPRLGALGAAVATASCAGILLVGFAFIYYKEANTLYIVPIIKVLISVVLGVGVIIVVGIGLGWPVYLIVIFVFPVYFVVLFIMGVINVGDLFSVIGRHKN